MSKHVWWIGLTGTGLALVGVWGAWVPHRAAALVLSGWDLAEYTKFLPGTSATRELFYLPAWCAGIALSIMARRTSNQPAGKLICRAGLILMALALMVAILPPYPHLLNNYQSPEFRWQFFLGVSGLLLILASWFSRNWSNHLVGGLLLTLALIGAVLPLWQFLNLRGTIEAVYGSSLGWGWGLGLFLAGWTLVGVTGGRLLFKPRDNRKHPQSL